MDPAVLVKIARILMFLGAAYGLFAVTLYFLQGAILFPATRAMARTPADIGLDYENIVRPVNGFETHAWYVPLENHRGAVLFSHGNAGNLSDRLESIALLRSFGFSVLAYDYGGYGNSTGSP